MESERKMFIQDDDCQWYLIPTSTYPLFRQLEEAAEYDAFIGKFGEYQCDHPTSYTFDNVRSLYEH